MLRIDTILLQFIQPEYIILEILRILAVNGIQFPPGGALGKEGTAEERTEAQQRLREAIVDASIHFKVVNSPLAVGEGIIHSPYAKKQSTCEFEHRNVELQVKKVSLPFEDKNLLNEPSSG